MENIDIFSKRLKETRIRKNLSQSALAEKIHITAATISAYENSDETRRKKPTLENALAVADGLEVSLDWLCGLKETPDNTPEKNSSRENVPLTDVLKELVDITKLNGAVEIISSHRASEAYQNTTQITIWESKIANFMDSWQKIVKLYREGTITQSMCDDWVQGTFKKYERCYVDFSKNPAEIVDPDEIDLDDLPF